jgi:hypothetical protein
MVDPEAPDNESLRLELQQALGSYQQWVTQLIQVEGFIIAADVVLLSYGFSQKLAAILLLASGAPILILALYVLTGSIASPFVNLILRIERRLQIREDSLGAAYMHTWFRSTTSINGKRIEDLSDEEVRHLNPEWEKFWGPIPIILYALTVGQFGLFVLSLTVFHYRFM